MKQLKIIITGESVCGKSAVAHIIEKHLLEYGVRTVSNKS